MILPRWALAFGWFAWDWHTITKPIEARSCIPLFRVITNRKSRYSLTIRQILSGGSVNETRSSSLCSIVLSDSVWSCTLSLFNLESNECFFFTSLWIVCLFVSFFFFKLPGRIVGARCVLFGDLSVQKRCNASQRQRSVRKSFHSVCLCGFVLWETRHLRSFVSSICSRKTCHSRLWSGHLCLCVFV